MSEYYLLERMNRQIEEFNDYMLDDVDMYILSEYEDYIMKILCKMDKRFIKYLKSPEDVYMYEMHSYTTDMLCTKFIVECIITGVEKPVEVMEKIIREAREKSIKPGYKTRRYIYEHVVNSTMAYYEVEGENNYA